MSRLRSWVEDSTWHLFNRGNGGEPIFRSLNDYALFLDLLRVVLRETNAICFAFALMLNHFHLVLRTRNVAIGRIMNRLQARYAKAVNQRWDERDHVFGPRYGSRRIRGDEYLRRAIAYVNANPLAAGIVPNVAALEVYPWTSYASVVGRKQPDIIDPEIALMPFGVDRVAALANLRAEIEHSVGIADELEREFDVNDVLEDQPVALVGASRNEELLQSLGIDARDPAALLIDVCARLGVNPLLLRHGSRTRDASAARAIVAWIGVAGFFATQAWMARFLGVSRAALGDSLARGEELSRRLLDPKRREGAGSRG